MKKIDIVTTPERSRLMSRVRQSGTDAEHGVTAILRRLRVRYETNAGSLPGRPDVVNRDLKWAIFVNGCFWHAHRGCKLWRIPKSNRPFWISKFEQNRRRDKMRIRDLERLGFGVMVIWQCELEEKDKLKRRILRFIERASALSVSKTNLPNGTTEEYKYISDSVARTVHLSNGRCTTTRLRLGTQDCGSPRSAFDFAYLRKSRRPAIHRKGPVVRVADIFAGCGGLSLGAMEACRAVGKRFLSVLALDKEQSCTTVYKRNFRCGKVYSKDITEILDGDVGSKPTASERQFLKGLGRVTILLAGPPCQGNSDLNNHTRREDPRNALYERVARFVELVRPDNVLIENVPTSVHGKERAVQKSLRTLRNLGYNVDAAVVDLSIIGVPQIRRRHVVIASKLKELKIAELIERSRVDYAHSVRWAMGDLQRERRKDLFTRSSRHTAQNVKRIRFLHKKSFYELPDRLRPPCHRKGGHSYKSMYGRLKFDEPAQTITSGFGSPGQGRFIHPVQMRALTPHEAARLQFFPDFFDFLAIRKRSSIASMIGNAAPMKLSYVLCLPLLC